MEERRSSENSRQRALQELRDLIAALDRRMPHVERAGESDIARDAEALRLKALARIAELENDKRDT
jgi:hypothetical protein